MLQRDRQRQRERGTFSGGGAGALTAEYLVVAGGGGGAAAYGGGGAGGYRTAADFSIALGSPYAVTVGAGGNGGAAAGFNYGVSGNDSSFSVITSAGGGGGAPYEPSSTGLDGGSGGGAGYAAAGGVGGSGNVPATTPPQGNDGGSSSGSAPYYGGGGGGGAGAVGGNGTTTNGGAGGAGLESYITGASAYRAGGGGGGVYTSGTPGAGGLGGGGAAGASGVVGTSGTANTGGGGGAGHAGTTLGSWTGGGAGGSGVVIIRVPSTVVAEFSAGVVYNYIPLDDFNVYEITAAGVIDTVTFSQGAVTTVNNSLRFNDDDSAYLARTPASAGNRQKFTWSGWIKRATLGTAQFVFGANSGASVDGGFVITASDTLGFTISGNLYNKYTSAVFRDLSAWYHVVIQFDTTQAAAENRIRIYVNGKEETDYTTQNSGLPPLNASTNYLNTATNHTIGRLSGYNQDYLDGYLSDVYFIDGQALDPSRFGKQDADGIWQPISYTGSYGTNGFHLDFADNSTAAALGTDTSGNGNDWTPSGITTDDQVTDTPSVNYATLNSAQIAVGNTLSDGNLRVVTSVGNYGASLATMAIPSTGKWYWEVKYVADTGLVNMMSGIWRAQDNPSSTLYVGQTATSYGYYAGTGNKWNNNADTSYGIAYGVGSTVGVAFDADAGSLTFYTNGVSQGTAFTGLTETYYPAVSDGSGGFGITAEMNFGQRPFAYTPPTGFVALNSSNLPAPTITDGKAHFQPALYTGNGTTQAIGGLEFQPDFVWIKSRSNAFPHALYDAVRGVSKRLQSSTTSAESSPVSGVQSFDSSGFTVGSDASGNSSGATFVSWNWNAGGTTVTNTDGTITSQVRANTDAGISIVSYTGTGAAATVGHGLSTAPEFIIAKNRDGSTAWAVYSDELGISEYLLLSGANAAATSTTVWNGTRPTSSVFSVNTSNTTNGSSNALIAYCFHSVEGFSKFGSYTGNGSADGPFVYTGFRPAFVMIKVTTVAGYHWYMKDTTRSPYNEATQVLYANLSNAEATIDADIDFVSNGFKVRDTGGINVGTNTYIYMAFAENPFKTARAR